MSENLASQVVELLKRRGETVAFCESLTAGLASATIAEVPGASAVLKGGLVTYATELKVELAGVSQELIDAHGVVSPQCAAAMAQGAATRCRSDWAISLTGVAGPSGQDGHAVGEVWIGLAGPDAGTIETYRAFEGKQQVILAELGRHHIRESAVQQSFRLLIDYIESH
ncbi:competence-damage inducible protein [Corynebacterium suranareeae]|uniref:Competence-damage inducible protein n=1 Tax=Corynebacterium suranareeae TaxID=2506452 RepID=A0A160PQD0_9CORY|nr:CinA family protein [Corynebacterium suranareeae]BAU96297.1 competence-damage inducible protein [Corynebacterium suranareeae]